MVTSVHQLDDGAWLSVNDERRIAVGDLWRLLDTDFCGCESVDFLAEGFAEVALAPPTIEARVAGRCITCGTEGVTGWLPMGRADPETGAFRAADLVGGQVPELRWRAARPRRVPALSE